MAAKTKVTKMQGFFKNGGEKAIVDDRDVIIHKWEKPREEIVGILKQTKRLKSEYQNGEYNLYILDTDDGLQGIAGSTKIDQVLSARDFTGHMISIQFNGKINLKKGRSMNDFTIQVSKNPVEDLF